MWREFVELAEKREESFADLCARFGVSRKTGYKWLNRFRAAGQAGLEPQSRRPKSSPRKTPEAVVETVLALRRAEPDWTVARLHQELQARGVRPLPAPSTVDLILRRQREAAATAPVSGHEAGRSEPNYCWAFEPGAVVPLAGGETVVPVWVRDEATGFMVGSILLESRREEALMAFAEELFRRHGLPWRVRVVRDSALEHEPACRAHSPLTVWLMRLGIVVDFAFRPTETDATEPGRQLASRLLALAPYQRAPLAERLTDRGPAGRFETEAAGLPRAQAEALRERLREQHNFGGRQEAMQRRSPISLFRPSPRCWPGALPEAVPDPSTDARLVSEKGIFTFRRRLVHVGRVFAGLCVELTHCPQPERYLVSFARQGLGWVDLSATPADLTTSLPLSAG